jgi:hypothetical protein
VDQNGRDEHDPTRFPPKTAAVPMREFPCVLIFHGACGSVADEEIDLVGTMLSHDSSGDHHDHGNEQIRDKHEPPKPHSLRLLSSEKYIPRYIIYETLPLDKKNFCFL